jgi:hypothetical protein
MNRRSLAVVAAVLAAITGHLTPRQNHHASRTLPGLRIWGESMRRITAALVVLIVAVASLDSHLKLRS